LFALSSPAKRIVAMSSQNPQRVDCFSVFATADPSTLLRVLEVFSLFGVIPERCHSSRLEADQDQLVIDIQAAGLSSGRAAQLVRRLDRVITVTQVLHSERFGAERFRAGKLQARAA
jgi:acetolactate synthase small subunit